MIRNMIKIYDRSTSKNSKNKKGFAAYEFSQLYEEALKRYPYILSEAREI